MTTDCLVVDASVVVSWYLPEALTPAALRVQACGARLLAPDFLRLEVANVLWKRIGKGELTAADAEAIQQALAQMPLKLVPMRDLLDRALAIAIQYRRSVYDSLYVALAVLSEGRLVTADRRLFNALQPTPLATHLIWVETLPT